MFLDEPLLRSRIIRKEFEYLFECYTLAKVFARTVHNYLSFCRYCMRKTYRKVPKINNNRGTFVYNSPSKAVKTITV